MKAINLLLKPEEVFESNGYLYRTIKDNNKTVLQWFNLVTNDWQPTIEKLSLRCAAVTKFDWQLVDKYELIDVETGEKGAHKAHLLKVSKDSKRVTVTPYSKEVCESIIAEDIEKYDTISFTMLDKKQRLNYLKSTAAYVNVYDINLYPNVLYKEIGSNSKARYFADNNTIMHFTEGIREKTLCVCDKSLNELAELDLEPVLVDVKPNQPDKLSPKTKRFEEIIVSQNGTQEHIRRYVCHLPDGRVLAMNDNYKAIPWNFAKNVYKTDSNGDQLTKPEDDGVFIVDLSRCTNNTAPHPLSLLAALKQTARQYKEDK